MMFRKLQVAVGSGTASFARLGDTAEFQQISLHSGAGRAFLPHVSDNKVCTSVSVKAVDYMLGKMTSETSSSRMFS